MPGIIPGAEAGGNLEGDNGGAGTGGWPGSRLRNCMGSIPWAIILAASCCCAMALA